jgi:Plasmid pRiA4b ORF-3-like protein
MLKLSEFQYFGDGWEHTIEIEDLVVPSTQGKRIQGVAGENASRPEDVGGPHAYFDFLATIRDPTHEEHHTPLESIGGSFDPIAPDMNYVAGLVRSGAFYRDIPNLTSLYE